MLDSLQKEREAEELKINMFVRLPQYKDSKSGYLWKRGNLLSDWKRRFFFIHHSQLLYLRNSSEIVYTSLLMSKSSEMKDFDHLFAFEIFSVSPAQRQVLLAESESEVKEWLHALNRAAEQGLLGYSESEFFCADCLAPRPEWCSLNLGVLLCTACSGIHRSLGSHLSKVRSLQLDAIDAPLREAVFELHNAHQVIWGEGFRPPRYASVEEKEEYIRSKYQHKAWIKASENCSREIVAAVEEGSIVRCFQAVVAGARKDEGGVLHLAAKNGWVKIVAMLVTLGWEVEAKNFEAFTPLEVALLGNQNEVVEYIVKLINPIEKRERKE
jgi:hypothetical protein